MFQGHYLNNRILRSWFFLVTFINARNEIVKTVNFSKWHHFFTFHRLQGLGLQHLFLGHTIQSTATIHHLPASLWAQALTMGPKAYTSSPCQLLAPCPAALLFTHSAPATRLLALPNLLQVFTPHLLHNPTTQLKMENHSSKRSLSFLLLQFWPEFSPHTQRLPNSYFISWQSLLAIRLTTHHTRCYHLSSCGLATTITLTCNLVASHHILSF